MGHKGGGEEFEWVIEQDRIDGHFLERGEGINESFMGHVIVP